VARYLLRRIATSVVLLALVSVLVFVVLRLLPGDPTIARLGVGQSVDPRAVEELRREMGLDEPILRQYLDWIGGLLRGDLGSSFFSRYSVGTLISQRLAATVELAVASLLIGVALALPLALAPALWPRSLVGRAVTAYVTLGMAAPPFIFGIILIAIFSVELGWLPVRGYVSLADDPIENLRLLLLPAVTLGITLSAPLIRYLGGALDEALRAPYVRTARGKGLSRRDVVVRHALPNALLPALTALGVMVGSLLGGVVVVEYVFRWPGMGSLIVDAVLKRDYAVLQTAVLLAAGAFIAANLVVDLLYGVLDPRLRVTGRRAR
jgi:peptide/nickel transport system permease protein